MSGTVSPVERRSAHHVRFMGWWLKRYLRRHLNGLRVARWGLPDVPGDASLIVYSNHPAWWDAVVYVLLARRLFPAFQSFAPMDAAMLAKYAIFGRIGAFPIEPDTVRGGLAFLTSCREILARPERAVWITAQGRFADGRERPLGLRPGVSRLVERTAATHCVPLAIDYTFWTERGAEALVAFGPPLAVAELARHDRPARESQLEAALTALMDRLAADAVSREPGRFISLLEGHRGIGGMYDAWRRGTALVGGKPFDPAHRAGTE